LQKSIAKASFKHAPAENGECISCHDPHESQQTKLLKKAGRKLCMDCHEEKEIAAVKVHQEAPTRACGECHDPHSGKDKSLLKAAARLSARAQ
jgi:predicted CXXCH cytochrome family protein